MKDFEVLKSVCLKEIADAGIKPGNIIKWSLNSRAKTRWGLCKKHPNGDCEIEIATKLLSDDRISENACKETIIHEILHTCPECKGHTGRWKIYADRMNRLYGYNIKRVTTGEEKGVENHISKPLPYKYIFVCKKCGGIVVKKRACDFTRNYKKYLCGRCGGRTFEDKTGVF